MSTSDFNRRRFLKMMGIGGAALGAGVTVPRVVGRTADGVLLQSEQEYGAFLVEKLSDGSLPYRIDPDKLKQMSEKFTMFSRNTWDPERRNRPELSENLTRINLVDGGGKVPNQTRLDYALMAASWSMAYTQSPNCYAWTAQSGRIRNISAMNPDPWNPADLDMNWEDASLAVKHAGLFFGASLAGIARFNRLWLYSDSFAPRRGDREGTIPVLADGERFEKSEDAWYIPKSMNRVVALAFEEDYRALSNSPGRLASAATGNGYSRMAFTSFCLAEFIRALGYRALPAGNGVALSIPIAIDAGLGELGRMGLLVTPKYGPRVRLAKVITDMPLVHDSPISFGVSEFCERCLLCADHCPSESVTKGGKSWHGDSRSNNPGSFKWYTQVEGCYDFNGFSCSNCKMVCPFNKPNNSWLHKMIRQIISARVGVLDKLMVSFDQASGYGTQLPDSDFWKEDGLDRITAREPKI